MTKDINLLQQRLQNRVKELQEENRINNIPEYSKDANCSEKSYYVATYPNGQKSLIKVSTETGKLLTLKNLFT